MAKEKCSLTEMYPNLFNIFCAYGTFLGSFISAHETVWFIFLFSILCVCVKTKQRDRDGKRYGKRGKRESETERDRKNMIKGWREGCRGKEEWGEAAIKRRLQNRPYSLLYLLSCHRKGQGLSPAF